MQANPELIRFWSFTHADIWCEVVVRGIACQIGFSMDDGLIQGRILSTKALLLAVEFIGRRYADELVFNSMTATWRAFAEDIGIVSRQGINPIVLFILITRQSTPVLGTALGQANSIFLAPAATFPASEKE